MSLREAAKLALEALEWSWRGEPLGSKEWEAIAALRSALAEDAMQRLTDEQQMIECSISNSVQKLSN